MSIARIGPVLARQIEPRVEQQLEGRPQTVRLPGPARDSGREFKNLPREEMEALWDVTKNAEGKSRIGGLAKAQARK